MTPEMQQSIVASVANSQFESRGAELLDAIKTDSQIEAVERFMFDGPSSTLTLAMATIYSVSEEAKTSVAYDYASALSGFMWLPEIADQVSDPALLPTFDLLVDDLHFVCGGSVMAALADKELSQESFIQQCRV